MTSPATKPNITEVARRTGLTRSTVSKVFAPEGRYGVSQKTRELVLRIAREIGYEPSVAARRMIARRSRVIALLESESWSLLNSINDPSLLAADRFSGAHDVTHATGYDLLPLTMKVSMEEQPRLLRMYLGQHFDGIICMAPSLPTPKFFHPLLEQGCPVVTDGGLSPHPNLLLEASWIDGIPFLEMVVAHLKAQGRKHLVYITHPASSQTVQGLKILTASETDIESFMTEHPETDAILVADEVRGWKIYQSLKKMGFHVPEKVTIAGLSDFRNTLKPLPIHMFVQAPIAFATRQMTRRLIAKLEPERLPLIDKMQFTKPRKPEILETPVEVFRALANYAEQLDTLRAAGSIS